LKRRGTSRHDHTYQNGPRAPHSRARRRPRQRRTLGVSFVPAGSQERAISSFCAMRSLDVNDMTWEAMIEPGSPVRVATEQGWLKYRNRSGGTREECGNKTAVGFVFRYRFPAGRTQVPFCHDVATPDRLAPFRDVWHFSAVCPLPGSVR
jgi:hypothetical protein